MISSLLAVALRKAMDFRCDGLPQLTYFSAEDFGVSSTEFFFYSGKNRLHGARYFVPNTKPKAVVVFFHGIGAGATAYMQEICYFAKRGYLVFAYDNTGCMASEGRSIGSLAQSLLDQEAFFFWLDSQADVAGLRRYAVGHSWGGFTALGAMDSKFNVGKVVSISGFLSLPEILMGQVKALRKFEGLLRRTIRKEYGVRASEDMVGLIRQSKAELLYIQGEGDPMVPKEKNYDVLEREFASSPRVKLCLVPGAMHNPYWTLEAQKYYYHLQNETRAFYPDFDVSFRIDYARLNEDDPAIMGKIVSFFEE